jgi:hypothetical protein
VKEKSRGDRTGATEYYLLIQKLQAWEIEGWRKEPDKNFMFHHCKFATLWKCAPLHGSLFFCFTTSSQFPAQKMEFMRNTH